MAAIGNAANRNMEIVRVDVTTANTWEIFTPPDWCRRVVVSNEHASEDLYIADPGTAAAAINTATDEYATIGAGKVLAVNFEPGRAKTADARRNIVLTRPTTSASRTVALILEG